MVAGKQHEAGNRLKIKPRFYPEDGSDMFLRKVDYLSTDYTTLSPRR
jgi:hypothetical protein